MLPSARFPRARVLSSPGIRTANQVEDAIPNSRPLIAQDAGEELLSYMPFLVSTCSEY